MNVVFAVFAGFGNTVANTPTSAPPLDEALRRESEGGAGGDVGSGVGSGVGAERVFKAHQVGEAVDLRILAPLGANESVGGNHVAT